MAQPEYSALVLAAGKGTRMKSADPKVMQPLLEEPMLYYVLEALKGAGIDDIAVVIGHGGEKVENWLKENAPGVKTVWQKEQLGTGHAVMCAEDWISDRGRILVINGDMPMVTSEDIRAFLDRSGDSDSSFVTCDLEDAGMYGRVIRSENGAVIIEAKDATPAQLEVHEINVGIYLFRASQLLQDLKKLDCDNNQREYYIVDLINKASAGRKILPVRLSAENLSGVNNPFELAQLSVRMRDRIVRHWMFEGVKIIDPSSVWISPRTSFEGEAFLYPNVQLWGENRIGEGCEINSGSIIRDSELKKKVRCLGYVFMEDSSAGEGSKMGPFCYLRGGTHLLANSFAGKFVELKNSTVGEGSKVPHLTYMGDAEIGPRTNIGAATVTCNYDGVNKHKTHIGADCFIGSDTMLVAPVSVGEGAMTGAGSVITQNVPAHALALGRGRQVVKEGWADRYSSQIRQKKLEG